MEQQASAGNCVKRESLGRSSLLAKNGSSFQDGAAEKVEDREVLVISDIRGPVHSPSDEMTPWIEEELRWRQGEGELLFQAVERQISTSHIVSSIEPEQVPDCPDNLIVKEFIWRQQKPDIAPYLGGAIAGSGRVFTGIHPLVYVLFVFFGICLCTLIFLLAKVAISGNQVFFSAFIALFSLVILRLVLTVGKIAERLVIPGEPRVDWLSLILQWLVNEGGPRN